MQGREERTRGGQRQKGNPSNFMKHDGQTIFSLTWTIFFENQISSQSLEIRKLTDRNLALGFP